MASCIKSFKVRKAKILGIVPGYDERWMRNLSLNFLRSQSTSAQYNGSRWWLEMGEEGGFRAQQVPFEPTNRAKVIMTANQLQITCSGKKSREGYHISEFKVTDEEQTLKDISNFVVSAIIEEQPSLPLLSHVPRHAPVMVNVEDKENLSASSSVSSSNSTRQRAFAKQTGLGSSGGASAGLIANSVPGASFYGTSSSTSSYQPQFPTRPSHSLGQLRNGYSAQTRAASTSPGLGSQGRPIPTMKMADSRKPTPYRSNSASSFTLFGATRGLTSSPALNGSFGSKGLFSGSYSSQRNNRISLKAKDLSPYDFDENDENENAGRTAPVPPPNSAVDGLLPGSTNANTPTTPVRSTSPSSPIGLINLGNSCYMNAVLQALFAQPSFNYDLTRINFEDFISVSSAKLRENGTTNETTKTVTKAVPTNGNNNLRLSSAAESASLILCVLNLLHSCNRNPPDALEQQKSRLLAVKSASKKFTDSQQHDAQEFLCCILDDLKEEHRDAFTAMKTATSDLAEAGIKDSEAVANPVTANFDFTLKKSILCQECDRVSSESVEEFNSLSVHIPNVRNSLQQPQSSSSPSAALSSTFNDDDDLPDLGRGIRTSTPSCSTQANSSSEISLQDCIDNFFQKEEIEYRSEQCGHDLGGVVSYCLASLPRVFVIHLKRFLYTMTSNVGTKCTQPVTIPRVLDLSKYCSKTVRYPRLVDNPRVHSEGLLKSAILSPSKLSPPRLSSVAPAANCRKRQLFDDSLGVGSKCYGDENVPMSPPPPPLLCTKRLRSMSTPPDGSFSSKSPPTTPTSSPSKDKFSSDGQYTKYQLSAIISHTGASSDYGHYTTDAYHSAMKRWFRFDDMAVKSISEAKVLEENKENGYIFIYTAFPVWEQADTFPSPNDKL